jgi:hypothetical protein
MFSPPMAQSTAQQRRNDLLQDAARFRLGAHGQGAGRVRVRLAVGRLLVAAGVRVAGRPRPDELPRLRAYPM